jgi:copper chaperone NosL
MRDLIDISVVQLYFGAFSFWSFYNRLYQYGHNLNPEAAIKVDPFTPPLFGRVRIANFWVESFPAGGSYALALFTALVFAALVHTYLSIRRNEANSQLKESQA